VAASRRKQREWAVRAARDLLAIDSYLSADNPKAAVEVVKYIMDRAEQLGRHAFLGRSLGAGRPRKLVLTRYPCNIHYRLTVTKVRIVRVLHQARREP
jgi:toxin ParE1/3/4